MDKAIEPRMHSAEHILNQTMDRIYECGRCFRAHVEKKKSKCDYHFDHELTEEEIKSLESKVNEVIQMDLSVSEEFLSRLEAAEQYNMSKVPDSAVDRIRIVKIGDYDACPCIGPHVQKTTDIGVFQIISTSFDNGVLRIRFHLSEQ